MASYRTFKQFLAGPYICPRMCVKEKGMRLEMQLRGPRRRGALPKASGLIRNLCDIGRGERFSVARACATHVHRLLQTTQRRHARADAAINTLTQALEAKDSDTAAHQRRLYTYTERVGLRLGLRDTQIAALRIGALLHDVGKLGVDTTLIRKPGPLTHEERLLMQQHSVIGDQLVRSLGLQAEVAPIVRHHHERWDGAGYPDGLRGEAIPLGARIVAVADAFDAMTTQRSYNRVLSRELAAARLRAGAGIYWDPQVVAAFLACLTEGQLA